MAIFIDGGTVFWDFVETKLKYLKLDKKVSWYNYCYKSNIRKEMLNFIYFNDLDGKET